MTPRNRAGSKKNTFLLIQLVASMDYGVYSRSVFNILDLFGTIGGILEIFMFVVELIMGPITEHAFICSAISTFYIIKHQSNEKFFKAEVFKKN
jgi:hypothetical protein